MKLNLIIYSTVLVSFLLTSCEHSYELKSLATRSLIGDNALVQYVSKNGTYPSSSWLQENVDADLNFRIFPDGPDGDNHVVYVRVPKQGWLLSSSGKWYLVSDGDFKNGKDIELLLRDSNLLNFQK